MSLVPENLLAEISQQSPSGDEKAYSRQLRESLTSLRKPEVPNGDADTSYRRAADWNSIVEISTTALTEQTKDIRIVCHLIEAWTQIRGFDGLADGVALMTDFVDTCWDRCNPAIEDGDLEVRSAPIENMLDDANRGTCFPTTIRQLRLLGDSTRSCNYLQYDQLHRSSDEQDVLQLAKIIAATDADWLRQLNSDITRALDNLQQLKNALDEKLGDQAPGLTYLRTAMEDCQRVISIHVQQAEVLTADESSSIEPTQSNLPVLDTTPFQRTDLSSRDAAYQQLTAVAEYLQRIEPHSPIPYLIHRAVKLGRLPFPDLVQQLVREEGILNELRREFGIAEEATD